MAASRPTTWTPVGEYASFGSAAAVCCGVPARRIGCISRHGERLAMAVSGAGSAVCAATGELIVLAGRMDKLQCAVVLAKLERFEWEPRWRGELGARYQRLLAAVPGLGQVGVRSDRNSVFAQPNVFAPQRAAVRAAGVPTAVHCPKPLRPQPAYVAFRRPDCGPLSVAAGHRVMSLSMSADLSEADQDRVVALLAEALAKSSPPAAATLQ